ncbi:efflux RND transporter permease subunit [Gallaecimonas pentaromativorans]|uniref:CzcA family heavy metal efflux pump n=1 Tax=Gallaecimonas pentaromativorans TaxID=584787 RepID=A0A3N1PAM2_9GAMM|nr:efflux RND transporter permease subunit [Gallaecimonas pentaromativorans]ROQ24147.1 CzcA family heavy metal efflux pump [Gallaecimonas pentaromativorans]
MLGLVRVALSRPYTFVVMALVLLILGPLLAKRTPKDIFPNIDIPVVAVAWQYKGLPPREMAGRVTTAFERVLTTTVNNIEHIEANSYNGTGIVKIFFQPDVDINLANAQVTAVAQTIVKRMPPGAQPPLIINYSASTVPVMQLALSGKGLTEQQLADLALNRLRTALVTVPGAAIPYPYGGKQRQVQIDLKPEALKARGMTGQDVANALAAQNLVISAGTEKIGDLEYAINLNNSPKNLAEIADFPVKMVNGAMVFIRDVASVRDGSAVQTNIVHVDGGRSVLMNIYKNGNTSTLDVINGVKDKLEQVKAQLPDNLEVKVMGDQSLFVEGAIDGVVTEGVIAALLTSLMILLFLGSWRSTLIVTVSIPLSILGAIIVLSLLGETLNIMTLGGLALAVGILVDLATVTIENVNVHLEEGQAVEQAILDGTRQILMPAFVSLLCICIVFVPMYLLDGLPRYLFVPMAEAVMLAMLFSFILSFTLVPTLAKYLLKPHQGEGPGHSKLGFFQRFQAGFERGFNRFRHSYHQLLAATMATPKTFIAVFMAFVMLSFALVPFVGRDFFPTVDAGQIVLHARAPVGTRIEETAARFAKVQQAVRQVIPAKDLAALTDNLGTYASSINTIYANNGMIGTEDGDIQISLHKGHAPTAEYIKRLREVLPQQFPDMAFSFLPADIVSQILNFGTPSPIEVRLQGRDTASSFAYANTLLPALKRIPGIADVRIQQSPNAPAMDVNVDRTRALYAGVTQKDIANSLVVNLVGSSQVAPTYWLNPQNNVTYPIVLQTPQYHIDSLKALKNVPVNGTGAGQTTVLGGLVQFTRSRTDAVVTEYNIQPVVQIFATVQGRDLGAVANDLQNLLDAHQSDRPKGTVVTLSGQVKTMNSAFTGLLYGLLGAIVMVYLLIVVNFQSWRDPFVIVSALPAALAGIVWMLFATHTTFSVPALTGAIMCMGVATANSVLVVSFAKEKLAELGDATQAAMAAGYARLRPVLMTALAMIIGMLPMALGLGDGGEQNAPLGRAVIGGLLFATIATLFFVPVLFSLFHRHSHRSDAHV